jgi:DNA-directed RNA polymerase
MLRQLGILDTITDITARRLRNAAENNPEAAAVTAKEDEEPTEEALEHPPTVSVLSKEQALQLLKPEHEQAKLLLAGRSRYLPEETLEGKFVNLVDLLPPVPAKGEFDVQKIKSSLYFFS